MLNAEQNKTYRAIAETCNVSTARRYADRKAMAEIKHVLYAEDVVKIATTYKYGDLDLLFTIGTYLASVVGRSPADWSDVEHIEAALALFARDGQNGHNPTFGFAIKHGSAVQSSVAGRLNAIRERSTATPITDGDVCIIDGCEFRAVVEGKGINARLRFEYI